MTTLAVPDAVHTLIAYLAARQETVAIAVAGSTMTGLADADSDIDLYVFVTDEIPLDVRRKVLTPIDSNAAIGNDWFGDNDELVDPDTGRVIDIMYFSTSWIDETLSRVLDQHRPAIGYTTAICHTIAKGKPVTDRDGWLASAQARVSAPYPEALREAIIAYNWPLLRTAHASYRRQIDLAVRRDDPVSINHRVAAFLASVFDIAFALHRTWHPGEKHLLDHLARLEGGGSPALAPAISQLLVSAPDDVVVAADHVCDVLNQQLHHSQAHPTMLGE
jgi:hypothetical protein